MYVQSSTSFSDKRLPEDSDLWLKHAGGFTCMYDLWLYVNCVHLLVYVYVYVYVYDYERYTLQGCYVMNFGIHFTTFRYILYFRLQSRIFR
jgi:hypothetical protein